MFSGVLFLLVPFAVAVQAIHGFDAKNVNNVVSYCRKKVKEFESTEMKYAKIGGRQIGEPVIFGKLIPQLLRFVYADDQIQRIFECISDMLNEHSDENLQESCKYRNLVKTCNSERPATPQCDISYPYRTLDGTCNNLFNPNWGSTLDCFRRLVPANYEGVSGMRKSIERNRPLPNPRTISRLIIKPRNRPSSDYNSLFVLFGQIVAHDLAELISTTVANATVLDCCKYARTGDQHPQCAPLLPEPNDPFYSKKNISCLHIRRMAPCRTCSVDKRNHINQVTSFIDFSLVYGQFDERAKSFRRNDGSGKLTSQLTEFGELLPPFTADDSRCKRSFAEKPHFCFNTGDTRVNQHTVLAMFQTIFVRKHNRIANRFKQVNPHWDEERLYQESKKFLIAEFQVIIYNEFLPILLGPELMSKYDLYIGSGSGYDCTVNPSLSIEFNAAAFRVHSLIPGKVVPDEDFEYFKVLFLNSSPLYNNRTSAYIEKMSRHPAQKFGCNMPKDLTNYLYREKFGRYGFDLAAVDILRGRDVGLPTYTQLIEFLENRPETIRKFDDLKKYLIPECQNLLTQIYQDVRDIDLWVGFSCERIPDNMIISPTAAEIMAEQFRRLKFGDRFYWEHDGTLTSETSQNSVRIYLI